jgi:hypothetical protein
MSLALSGSSPMPCSARSCWPQEFPLAVHAHARASPTPCAGSRTKQALQTLLAQSNKEESARLSRNAAASCVGLSLSERAWQT